MRRLAYLIAFAGVLFSQQPKQEQEPPEEDESLVEKEYSFNPLQAAKEMKIGDYYAKRGNHKAAAARYQEATKWEPTNARAWLRLGESREKLKDKKGAKEAYAKYVEIEPDSKQAQALKKQL